MHTEARPAELAEPDFDAVRAEFDLSAQFPPDVLAEAARVAALPVAAGPDRVDATDVELVTIDPPGSMDLDQAVGIVRRGDGFRVHYAIADLGAVVVPDGVLDAEVRRRGQTIYLPDGSTPLHPPVLSADASSLLPGVDRAAVLWTIDVDAAGERVAVDVRRAVVRSRARLDYAGVQADVDAGRVHAAIAALPDLGRLRHAVAIKRGAIELELPEQEVVPDGAGGWTVQVRKRLDVEAWNAEISLLTGMSAAAIMLEAGVGLLRTLPAPEQAAVDQLRHTARVLGVAWPHGASPAEMLAGLPVDTPATLAMRRAATTLLRGAGYAWFDTATGTPPPADPGHGGVGGPYSHVTAPLRRLVDRFGTEVCLAVTAGLEVPAWLLAALPTLPEVMATSDALAGQVDRACVDRTEAVLLATRIGQEFDAVVLREPPREGDPGEIYVHEPPVLARCTGALKAGATVRVRLTEADPATGRVLFTTA
ncbi:RNB domain-containing ribonuclease [Pseudonocardia sp. GCM10023141]|uniref:RNB domain-containing ribonuclease n=1 Tax=Pseudonocardia sp. GCM10023141 TaxID=3252653 RepID=UPI003615D299